MSKPPANTSDKSGSRFDQLKAQALKAAVGIGVVLGAAAALVAIIDSDAFGDMWDFISGADDPTPVEENIEIVLDSSESMNDAFESGTKLDAARGALEELFALQVSEGDNLALRRFGGDCTADNNTELIVDFDTENTKSVREAAADLRPAGELTLASGIVEATGDFAKLGSAEDTKRRIIVITSGTDSCFDSAKDHIAEKFMDRNIKLNITYVALTEDSAVVRELKEIAESTGGRVLPVGNDAELVDVLSDVLIEEPLADAIIELVFVLNSGVDELDDVTSAANGGNYQLAEDELDEANELFKMSELPASVLEGRQPEYEQLVAVAAASRSVVDDLLAASELRIDAGKEGDADAEIDAIEQFNTLRSDHRSLIGEMNELLSAIQGELLTGP